MFKRLWSQLLALVLVVVVGLAGCSASPGGLVGDYRQDTVTVLNSMKAVRNLWLVKILMILQPATVKIPR